MTIALTDCRISKEIEFSLCKYADKTIKLPPLSMLPSPVASHPDMLIFAYGKRIFTWKQYFVENKNIFDMLEKYGFKTECICENPSHKYPNDVLLNCALLGNNILANRKHMSVSLTELANSHRLNIVHTNQGYAKCSTAIVSENAIITADNSVYTSAVNAGINSLKIRQGYVGLDGYNTGFIGGACGSTDDTVFFCGNISLHPDCESIVDFCRLHGKGVVSLATCPIYDFGTVIILKT